MGTDTNSAKGNSFKMALSPLLKRGLKGKNMLPLDPISEGDWCEGIHSSLHCKKLQKIYLVYPVLLKVEGHAKSVDGN